MERFVKRTICFLLALIMEFGSSASVLAMELSQASDNFEEAETFTALEKESLKDTIRSQVETFAKSIDQKDADGSAADKLVIHGLGGNGKKLSAGKSHPLTATIYNSKMMQTALSDSCTKAIFLMQSLSMEEMLYSYGSCNWGGADSDYRQQVFSAPKVEGSSYEFIDTLSYVTDYTGGRNDYDNSLAWMVHLSDWRIQIKMVSVSSAETVFEVTSIVSDRFDFDTASGLLSGLAALLFEEFDWESKVSFKLKVPNGCTHESENYHWSYDPENLVLVSESSEEFTENYAQQCTVSSDGSVFYYHKLENPIRLFHNRPWVLEYDAKGDFTFALAPTFTERSVLPVIWNFGITRLFARKRTYVYLTEEQKKEYGMETSLHPIRYDYGVNFGKKFSYNMDHTYTVRLENEIDSNGENMLYLSIYDHDLGKEVLKKTAMTEYYLTEPWGGYYVKQNENSEWVCGKDFVINYIGNEIRLFSADYFDLRIWENGKDSAPESCFADKITKPTCTEKGYTTHTCALCGYSYKDSNTDALGHSFTEWETVTKPTAENPGEEQRKCKNCEHSESRVIPALGYTLSDINLDGSVDVMDAYFIRLIVAKLVEPTAKQIEIGDVDLDGKITAIDANIIRKYAIGIIKNLPVEQ